MASVVKKILSVILAVIIMMSIASVSYAYNDGFPNTHRNTGKNIKDLIEIAKTQVGYTELNTSTGSPIAPNDPAGYTKYGESFGAPTGEWCAYFVSWCARQAGIPTSVLPRLGNCAASVRWYKNYSVFRPASSGYVPKAGDIMFFNWSGGETAKHVGIVTGVSGDKVYTIEGNTGPGRGTVCCERARSRTANYVVGYGVPAYNDSGISYHFAGASGSLKYTSSKLSVITTAATEITTDNATLHGSATNAGRLLVSSAGFMFGNDKNKLTKYPMLSSTTSFELELDMNVAEKVGKLTPNTTYYYCTYVRIDGRDYLGPMYAVVTVNDKPQQLFLSDIAVHVGVGRTTRVAWTQLPYGSIDKGVTWKSADEKIATVTNDGVITGVGYGSVRLTATTNYGSASADCQVSVLIPTAENLQVVNDSEQCITLKWDAVPDAEGYIVYRSESPDEDPVEYQRLKGDATSFSDTQVSPGERYYYSIVTLAHDAKYDSDPTPTVQATARLAKPGNVTADILGSWINVSWDKIDEAKTYLVYRSTCEKGLYTIVGTVSSEGFVDHQVLAGQTYYYKIVASNGNEKTLSDYSDIVSVTAEMNENPTIFVPKDVELPSATPTPVQPNDATLGRVHLTSKNFMF